MATDVCKSPMNNSASSQCDYDVVICGAGPTGLIMALGLLDPDIKILMLTKHTKRSLNARATNIWPRNIESIYLYDRALYDRFAAKTTKVTHWSMAFGSHTYFQLSTDGIFNSRVAPFTFFLPQTDTEQILEDHIVTSQGSHIELRTGWCLESLRADVRGPGADFPFVHLRIKEVATQTLQDIRTRFLVGCDGSRSAVRSASQIDFDLLPRTYSAYLADGKITYSKQSPGPDMMDTSIYQKLFFVITVEGAAAIFIPVKKDMIRMALTFSSEDVPEGERKEPTLAEFNQKLAALKTNYIFQLSEAAFLSSARFWFGLCRSYSDQTKRVFVAGDAAHVHSPVGGQGMNLGMQDAFNLSWKLRMCIKHPNIIDLETLLDSYEFERRPLAEVIVKRTYQTTTYFVRKSRFVWWLCAQAVRLIYRLTFPRSLRTMSQLDLNYSGSTLCVDDWHRSKWYYLWDRSGVGAGYHIPFTDVKLQSGQKQYLASLCNREGFNLIYFPSLRIGNTQTTHDSALLGSIDENWTALRDSVGSFRYLISKVVVIMTSPQEPSDWDKSALYFDIPVDEHKTVNVQVVQDVDSRVQFVGDSADSCLYVIRPDYFVGFRSRPFRLQSLWDWFARFTLSA